MEVNREEDQAEKDFKFPLSKRSRTELEKLESNINSIIDDDEDPIPTLSKDQISQPLPQKEGSANEISTENTDGLNAKMNSLNINAPASNSSPPIPSPEGKSNSKLKLSIMSNNFRPKPKATKKGKLRKPQSQKEPKLTYPREFGGAKNQVFGGAHIVDNPNFIQNQGLISDAEGKCPSSHSNNIDRTTSSSVASSNYYGDMGTYQPAYPGYSPQPNYGMYHQGYYQQQYPMQHSMVQQPVMHVHPGYYNEHIQNPNMGHMYPNHSTLETVSSCGSVVSETLSQQENALLRSPNKPKKGFRKVKSTNEKSLPIDPQARQLIQACDREFDVMKKLELLKGQLNLLIYNQSGSRFLQRLLTKANQETIEFFLNEIESSINQLMMDKYGNYFCQELLHSCSGNQRLLILEKIEENFIQVCRDKKGTHTIQKMVDLATLPEEEKFFEKALKGEVAHLSTDQQGTHIIQKIIVSFSEENRLFAFEEIVQGFMKVSKTSHGLCVIKKLIANTSSPNRPTLVNFCRSKVIELMQDPFGNYALQEIMDKWPEQGFLPLIEEDNSGVVCSTSKIAQLSIQKYSSNVVEKCIKMGNKLQRDEIILQIAKIDKLVNLMHNSFGNYVVQTALELSEGETKRLLASSIYNNISAIQDRKIKMKWVQLLSASIQNHPTLPAELDLSVYLQDSGMAPKVDVMSHSQVAAPGYDYQAEEVPSNFIRKDVPITIEPVETKPPVPAQVEVSSFDTFDDPYGNKADFQMFGGFGMTPQFDGDDSDG